MGSEKTTVLMILGSHRSGTSSLAGTLACLGATLPRNLMPASVDNEKGFFEPADIANLHDALLGRAGSSWHDIAPFPEKWYSSPDFGIYAEALAETYRSDYGDAALAILKEPRINRLIPLWEHIFKEVGAAAKVVIINRSPIEVAKSLQARDRFPLPVGLLIWLRNQLDAERSTRHLPRAFVNYDDLVAQWRSVISKIEHALDITLPGQGALSQSKVEAFLDDSLRHHRASPEHGATGVVITDWALEAFRILSSDELVLSEAGRATLDRIRAQLDSATQAFAPVVELHQRQITELRQGLDARSAEEHRRRDEMTVEIERLRAAEAAIKVAHHAQIGELTRQIAERDVQLTERDAEIRRLREASTVAEAASETHARELAAERARSAAALSNLQAEIERLREIGAAIEKSQQVQVSDLAQRVSDRDLQLAEVQSQNDRLAAEVAVLRDEISTVYASTSWRITAALRWLASHGQPLDTPNSLAEPSEPDAAGGDEVRPQRSAVPAADARALFDVAYYLHRYSDVARSSMDPWEHFATVGFVEGRNPNALFDTTWYLRQNPDAADEGLNPLAHYLMRGAARGSNPSPDFDGAWYLQNNPDVAASGMNPLHHYLASGRAEGRLPKEPVPAPPFGLLTDGSSPSMS